MTQPTRMPVDNRALFEEIRRVLDVGMDARFTVVGHSMWPTLTHKRDEVILSPLDGRVKRGDVVLFCPAEGRYLLHRVCRVRHGQMVTAGDGNCWRDGAFSTATIVGRVTKIGRKGRWYSCTDGWYRLRSRAWMALYPLRPLLLKCLRFVAARRGGRHD